MFVMKFFHKQKYFRCPPKQEVKVPTETHKLAQSATTINNVQLTCKTKIRGRFPNTHFGLKELTSPFTSVN